MYIVTTTLVDTRYPSKSNTQISSYVCKAEALDEYLSVLLGHLDKGFTQKNLGEYELILTSLDIEYMHSYIVVKLEGE